jgi:hypothetical protein
MLGSGDHTGTFSFLIGMVFVVFCGIGISLVADTRLEFGSSLHSLKSTISADQLKLETLNIALETTRETWQREYAPVAGHEQTLAELESITSSNQARISQLRAEQIGLTRQLNQTEQNFHNYRVRIRTQARANCVGQALESLTLPNGRSYRDVVVRGFDELGLRIHHQGGSARLSYEDLPESWKNRLHWQEDELKITQRQSPPSRKSVGTPETLPEPRKPIQKTIDQRSADRKPREDDIKVARTRFIQSRQAYLHLRSQASAARLNASSSRKSVPGSLETWAARAEKLERHTFQLRAGFLQAKSELSSISPGDPLLQQPTP